METTEKEVTLTPQTNIQVDLREISPQGRYIKLEDKLGSGAYKDVWRAYDTNDGIEVAWNVVKLSRIPPVERKRIKTEVKLLKDIQHKNIIRYYNSWVDREKEQIIFVTEMMSSGSLKHYLRKNSIIRWNAVKKWCKQILSGLKFLHLNHIIHRDIKCDNLFINGTTGDIRIGDLGLSTRITEERSALKSINSAEIRQITAVTLTCLGTPEFMAPEMYEESYDEKVDIYAFGMCVIEMVTGLIPYHLCTSAAQVYKKVINGDLPPELDLVQSVSSRAAEFIRLCLSKRNDRPSAEELLEHQFLQPNSEEDYKEVRSRHRIYEMVIDEGDEENEDLDDDQFSDGVLPPPPPPPVITSPGDTIPASRSSDHPIAKIIENFPVPDPALAGTNLLSTPVQSTNPMDPLSTPFRTVSGGSGSNGSGFPRLRKTLIVNEDIASGSSVLTNKATQEMVIPVSVDQQSTAEHALLSPPMMIPSTALLTRPAILVEDVVDHKDLLNTLIIFLQLPAAVPSLPSFSTLSPTSSKLVIEFEFDLLRDNLQEIIEEMLLLEEFQQNPAITKDLLIEIISPIISAAQQLLLEPRGTTTGEPGETGEPGSSAIVGPLVAQSAIRRVLSTLAANPATLFPGYYTLLWNKYILPTAARAQPAHVPYAATGDHTLLGVPHSPHSINSLKGNRSLLLPGQSESNPFNPDGNIPSSPWKSRKLEEWLDLDESSPVENPHQSSEYQDLLLKTKEQYNRITKDFNQKLSVITGQKEKAVETMNKDMEALNHRRSDLDRQLDSMQSKYKERMTEFGLRKTQAVEEHIEKSNTTYEADKGFTSLLSFTQLPIVVNSSSGNTTTTNNNGTAAEGTGNGPSSNLDLEQTKLS